MGKSIFDIGVTEKRSFLELNDLLIESIEDVIDVKYIYDPLNETSLLLFNDSWDDLILLHVLSDEVEAYLKIKREGIRTSDDGFNTRYRSGSTYGIKEHFENKINYLQTLELIYNIMMISNFTDNLQSKGTYKAKLIIRIFSFIKKIISYIGYEFVELDLEKKNQIISKLPSPDVYAYEEDECRFYKIVKSIKSSKKKIIKKPKYINLYEEYNTKLFITLNRKREILKLLSEIVDDKTEHVKRIFGNKISSDLYRILNNYNIRHDNKNKSSKKYNKEFDNMKETEIEKSYDLILNYIIAFWVIYEKWNN